MIIKVIEKVRNLVRKVIKIVKLSENHQTNVPLYTEWHWKNSRGFIVIPRVLLVASLVQGISTF